MLKLPSKLSLVFSELFLFAGLMLAFFVLFPQSADANTLNVPSATYPTLQAAADAANPGDIILVANGTYNQRVEITRSGSPGSYITFQAATVGGATIDGGAVSPATLGSGLVAQYKAIFDVYASHIKISGFRVINSGYGGIHVNQYGQAGTYDDVIIEKNYFSNIYSSAMLAARATNITMDGNEVTNSHLAAMATENEVIDMIAVTGFTITNNYVHGNGHAESICIKPLHLGDGTILRAGSGVIHHNTIIPIESAGIYLDGGSNIDVYDNIVHDGPGSSRGIALAVEGGTEIKNVRVYNNIVYNNGAYGIVVAFYVTCDAASFCSSGPIDNVQVVGNTVYHNDYTEGWGGGIVNMYNAATNIVFRNNISSQNNVAQIQVAAGSEIVENNLIDGSGGITGSNAVIGSPQFVSPGSDFHLQATSPAISAGVNPTLSGADYDGMGWKNPPSAGAYEYGGVPASPTPVPTPSSTPTPAPTASGSATPVPTASGTPVPTGSSSPFPTIPSSSTPIPSYSYVPVQISFSNTASLNSVSDITSGITNWLLGLASAIFIIFIIIGGVMYMGSTGDEERMNQAKKIIIYTIIAMVLVLISYSVYNTLYKIIWG